MAVMIRYYRGGSELRIVEEEREYVLLNNSVKNYITEPSIGEYRFKL